MNWPPSETLTLDTQARIALSPARAPIYTNELGALAILATGLHHLYGCIWTDEQNRSRSSSAGHAAHFNPSSHIGRLYGAVFQWYASSLTNYVDVVKHIGVSEGIIPDTKDGAEKYRKDALGTVLDFRHKIAAHPSQARRNKDDHAGDKLASITPIAGLVGGLWVCPPGTASVVYADRTEARSEVRMWSLTRIHQSLVPRFWPEKLGEQAAREAGDAETVKQCRSRAIENLQIPLAFGVGKGIVEQGISMPLSLEIAEQEGPGGVRRIPDDEWDRNYGPNAD